MTLNCRTYLSAFIHENGEAPRNSGIHDEPWQYFSGQCRIVEHGEPAVHVLTMASLLWVETDGIVGCGSILNTRPVRRAWCMIGHDSQNDRHSSGGMNFRSDCNLLVAIGQAFIRGICAGVDQPTVTLLTQLSAGGVILAAPAMTVC